jgi:endo-alpha-1,4-polygalactosaminidase (GH114 family)
VSLIQEARIIKKKKEAEENTIIQPMCGPHKKENNNNNNLNARNLDLVWFKKSWRGAQFTRWKIEDVRNTRLEDAYLHVQQPQNTEQQNDLQPDLILINKLIDKLFILPTHPALFFS